MCEKASVFLSYLDMTYYEDRKNFDIFSKRLLTYPAECGII